MKQKRAFSLLIWLIVVIALMTSATPPAEAKNLWHLRGFGVWIEPDLDYRLAADEGTDLHATAEGSFGLGISGEYQFSDNLGVEFGVFRATPQISLDYQFHDLGFDVRTTDNLAMTPLTLGLNIHLLPDKRLDLYVSPFLAYISNGDLEFIINETIEIDGQTIRFQESARVTVDNDFAYGATLGVDIPFSSRPWAIATSVRYLSTELNATEPEGDSIHPDFNSWILTVGLRYSF